MLCVYIYIYALLVRSSADKEVCILELGATWLVHIPHFKQDANQEVHFLFRFLWMNQQPPHVAVQPVHRGDCEHNLLNKVIVSTPYN